MMDAVVVWIGIASVWVVDFMSMGAIAEVERGKEVEQAFLSFLWASRQSFAVRILMGLGSPPRGTFWIDLIS